MVSTIIEDVQMFHRCGEDAWNRCADALNQVNC